MTDPEGNKVTFTYNNRRQVTKRTEPTPLSYQTKYVYDDNGNRTKIRRQTDDVSQPWQDVIASYTVEDQVASLKDPTNNTESYVYDDMRRLWKRTDAEGRLTEYLYDDLSKLWKVVDAATNTERLHTYTDNGLEESRQDASGNLTEFEYDGFDRLKKRIYDDSSYEELSYDANSNQVSFRTRLGNSIGFTYDALNRLATRSPASQPTVSFEYDLAGRLKKASKPTVTGDPSSGDLEYFYDSAGRLTKEKYPDGKEVQLQLDGNGNLTRLTYPDSYYVDRVYDELNRLTDVKLNGASSSALSFEYDKLSRRTRLAYLNGVVTDYEYASDNDLTKLAQAFVGSGVDFEYDYNSVHEPISQSVTDAAFMWHPAASGTTSYGSANGVNQYPSVGGASYSYDNAGCLTGDGVWTFGYDTENHLVSAAKTGVSASYLYDPQNRQTQKTVGSAKTRFIYSGLQMIAQYDGVSGSLVDRFVYGTDMDEPLIRVDASDTVTYLQHDKMGSIVAVTDASGAVVSTAAYGPFGESAALSGTPFGYTGQRYDAETGLYYFKNRIYSPVIGRFLQPDPAGYVDGLNLYTYVKNSPFVFTDPLGLAADCSCHNSGSVWRLPSYASILWSYEHLEYTAPQSKTFSSDGFVDNCSCSGNFFVAKGILIINGRSYIPTAHGYLPFENQLNSNPEPQLEDGPVGLNANASGNECVDACTAGGGNFLWCAVVCALTPSAKATCVRGYIC